MTQEPKVKTYSVLSTEDLISIMDDYASDDCERSSKAVERLVIQYQPFVNHLISTRYPQYAQKNREDLFQCGVVGLLEGISKYDPRRGSHLMTFCTPYIMHELHTYIAQMVHGTTAHYSNKIKTVKRVREQLIDTDKENDVTTIAILSGLSVSAVRKALAISQAGNTCPFDSLYSLESPEDEPDVLMEKEMELDALLHALMRLPETERNVVCLKFGVAGSDAPMSNAKIAEKLGISVSEVRPRVSSACRRLAADPELSGFRSMRELDPYKSPVATIGRNECIDYELEELS